MIKLLKTLLIAVCCGVFSGACGYVGAGFVGGANSTIADIGVLLCVVSGVFAWASLVVLASIGDKK